MFNKSILLILALCSLTLAFDPSLQKAYFSVKPNSPFSYEFPQTGNGTYAHFFANSTSRYILFNHTSGDAFTVLEDTASACQVASPVFQHIQYHVETDTLVYYCAGNSSLLFIDQAHQIVKSALSLNLKGTWPIAKLSTDGMSITLLAMDSLFNANPKPSALITVDMQTKQVASQILFDQNLTSGEAVVAFTTGTQGSYIATNRIENNNVITKLYLIAIIGTTYKITPLPQQVDLTSSKNTITKLFALGNYIVVNCDTTIYFLNNLGMMVRLDHIQTKELTPGIFHPALVRSTDGGSLYLHTDTFEVVKYTIVASGVFTKSFGIKQDMLVAKANKTSNDVMFTSDSNGVFFNIVDLQTSKYVRTTLFSYADLMLTDSTYTVVQILNKNTTSFNIFDLKTDNSVQQVATPLTKYYYNKDQQIITFLNAPETYFCQLTHIDLVSGKVWTTLNFTYSPDICASFVLSARVTEKGNPEIVLPLNQAYLIISETYGQVVFNTTYPTALNTDSINVNFDDLSFYYYTANKEVKNFNASLYTFNSQSKGFQLNSSNLINWRDVKSNGFFTPNHRYTVAIDALSFSIIDGLRESWFNVYMNDFNLVTGFKDQYKTDYMFFSFVSDNSQYPLRSAPMIYGNYGDIVFNPMQRKTTASGTACGPTSFALYDLIYSSVGVVRFFNADPSSSKTLISM